MYRVSIRMRAKFVSKFRTTINNSYLLQLNKHYITI